MKHQAYDWHEILNGVGVRQHPLYRQLERAEFAGIVTHFEEGADPYAALADYLLFGAAAVLGRYQKPASAALSYLDRLNAKTKAVALVFWAEEAIAHLQYGTAEGFITPLLEAYPDDPVLNAMVATCCFHSQDLARGWLYLKRGLASDGQHVGLLALLCQYQLAEGDMAATEKAARDLLEVDPINSVAFNILSKIGPDKVDDGLLERFEHRALDGIAGPANSASMLFDIGRVYDARGSYVRAFEVVERANEQMKAIPQLAGRSYDADAEFKRFLASTALFDRLSAVEGNGALAPVFIVGLPRTGSTLLDQALAAHPRAVSLGENDIIPTIAKEAEDLLKAGRIAEAQARMPEWRSRFFDLAKRLDNQRAEARSTDAPLGFVIDKMLGNSRHLGLLSKLFPEAVFLNSRRDMMDVGLSIYFSPLHRANIYATDLDAIAAFMKLELRVMAYWQDRGVIVLPVDYEKMVEGTELTLRHVLTHIGMDWDEACLRPHLRKQAVHTFSAHQVRKAVYRSSMGRWHHYSTQMAPLQKALQGQIQAWQTA